LKPSALFLCVVLNALAVGCALTPQPILGPPMQAGAVSPGWAYGTSYGPAKARVIGPDGARHEVRGNGESVLGLSTLHPGLIVPLFVAVRTTVLSPLELGAHAGWYGAGAATRVRLTDPAAPNALFLTADGQVGYAVPRDDRTSRLALPYAARLLVEGTHAVSGPWRLVGAAGLSGGYRRHGVDAGSVLPRVAIDQVFGAQNTLAVERSELRLEGALGGFVGNDRMGLELVLMPYALLAHGAARAECLNCTGTATLEAFRQDWGLSVVLSLRGMFAVGRRE
jgi:hypothetical protein